MAHWHYEQAGQPAGPVSEDDLRALVADGTVTPTTRVWSDGMDGWKTAQEVLPALFADAAADAPPAPAAAPAAMAAPVAAPAPARSQTMWHYDRSGQSTGPVSEDDLRALVQGGTVQAATRVWAEGMGDWKTAGSALPALFAGVATKAAETPLTISPDVSSTPSYTAPSYTPAGSYGATPMGGAMGGPVAIESQLVKAILVTLFCCLPFGIVAIIKAVEANNKAAMGDYAGATSANTDASKWIKYGLWTGVGVMVLYFVMMLGGVGLAALGQ